MKPNGGGRSLRVSLRAPSTATRLFDEFRTSSSMRQDAVRLRLGVARRQGRQARRHADAQWREPLVHGAKPLLGVDVWEHSYYIDYRNARPKYLETWFDNLINWEYVAELHGKS
jgi:Fe-Mn family superoxide dismutase